MLLVENDNVLDYWINNDIVDCGYINIVNDVEKYNIEFEEKLNNKNNHDYPTDYDNRNDYNNGETNTRNNVVDGPYKFIHIPRNNNELSTNEPDKLETKNIRSNYLCTSNSNRCISDTGDTYQHNKKLLYVSKKSTISNSDTKKSNIIVLDTFTKSNLK